MTSSSSPETYDLETQPQQADTATAAAPPRKPPAVAPPPPQGPPEPVWPRVLLIACLVVGGLGALWHGLHSLHYIMWMTGTWESLGRTMPQASLWWLVPTTIVHFALLLVALYLLYGCLLLKLRKPSFVHVLRKWSYIKIVLTFIHSLVVWVSLIMPVYRMLSGKAAEDGSGHWATAAWMFWSFTQLLWGLALPVFILVWFKRRSILKEVESWSAISED